MNYKVLYRKYRPDSFESLIGQNHVVTILKNSIKDKKIAHAYLFSGPRGTGKTSTARILAKSVNCLDNHDGIACEKCANCLSFGTNPDIIEIDAASNNGVDEIRELINNVKIMPTSLKYKVYIIDEVHMLSQSAFNALLLTLEEPPEHVIFVLATTNLESVPITIVSRCQRFDFKRINDVDIYNHLVEVCKNENIDYDDDGLKEIANLSDGGMRDALSILDQLSKNDAKITNELVSKEIGTVSNDKLMSIIKGLDEHNLELVENVFFELQSTSLNYKVVVKKLIYLLSDVASNILNGNSDLSIMFDTCKNIVMDLNDLLNKININVDPYILIKMIFLSYFDSKNVPIIDKKIETVIEPVVESKKDIKIDKKEDNKVEIKTEKNNNKNDEEKFILTRINNCFVNAQKSYLTELKNDWKTLINENKTASIKGLISDTEVVAASDMYAIVVTYIPHKENEINSEVEKIEKALTKINKKDYKLVFVSESTWNIEKNKYIENLKNKKTYTLMQEVKIDKESNEDMSFVADVFDLDKIEIE